MSNMSYCRFRNTIVDLEDCREALDLDGVPKEDEDEEEYHAALRLVQLCARIAEEHSYLVNGR